MQTVFFDLRRPVLEELYEHHVESARLHPVLVLLDAALEEMVSTASESLPPYLARSLLQAIIVAIQRILLDGGPYRCAVLCCAVLCCAVLCENMLLWHVLECEPVLPSSGHCSTVCCAFSQPAMLSQT